MDSSSDRDCNSSYTGFQSTGPTPCANGCGFFGAPATNGLCSKCYRELLFERESAVSAQSALKKLAPKQGHGDAAGEIDVSTAVTVKEAERPAAAAVKKKSRCACCKKKVGLLGFECRCGGTFCGAHRYAEEHNCAFDFRGVGRGEIARANPLVRADKICRI